MNTNVVYSSGFDFAGYFKEIKKSKAVIVFIPLLCHPILSDPTHFMSPAHRTQHSHPPAVPLLMLAVTRREWPLHPRVRAQAWAPVHPPQSPAVAQMGRESSLSGPALWQRWWGESWPPLPQRWACFVLIPRNLRCLPDPSNHNRKSLEQKIHNVTVSLQKKQDFSEGYVCKPTSSGSGPSQSAPFHQDKK